MRPTFLEKFGRIYTYPYGQSFLPEPVQNTIEQHDFERIIQRKRTLRPFHLECKITKRRLCYCPNSGAISEQSKIQMQMQQNVAGDMLNYYEGYPEDFESRLQTKVYQYLHY